MESRLTTKRIGTIIIKQITGKKMAELFIKQITSSQNNF